jgi:hypothetical protein
MEVPERASEHLVACRLQDHLVEEVVRAAPAGDLLVLRLVALRARLDGVLECGAELRLRLVEPVELLMPDSHGRQLGGEALELRAHLIGIADLARREAADMRASVRPQLDEPTRLELP